MNVYYTCSMILVYLTVWLLAPYLFMFWSLFWFLRRLQLRYLNTVIMTAHNNVGLYCKCFVKLSQIVHLLYFILFLCSGNLPLVTKRNADICMWVFVSVETSHGFSRLHSHHRIWVLEQHH